MLQQIGAGVWADPTNCTVSVDMREALDAAGLEVSPENVEAIRQQVIGMGRALYPRVKLSFYKHGFPLRN